MGDKNGDRAWRYISGLFLPAAVCALAVFACLFAYCYDNKYTAPGPKAESGILRLSEGDLQEHPVLMLVEGWEYYGGRLLGPEDFIEHPPLPDEYIYIGQYAGFEAGDKSASPHGSATYRLVIEIPDEPRAWTLELPEVFSACRVYINGRQAAAIGVPEPQDYRPETGSRALSFEATGRVEIIVAASDFSHLYSGMVYPPAFGLPEAVSALISARFLFRSLLCSAAVIVGLLSALTGALSRRKSLAVMYGLLCLFFVGYICYPITRVFVTAYQPFYALENLSFCAMLLAAMLLQRKICGVTGKWSLAFPIFGLIACLATAMLHTALPSGNLRVMLAYSALISAYEWITAGFITLTAARAVWKDDVSSRAILIGILTFDCALIMDRLLPLHEPIVTGWFPELASFVLVLSIGAAIGGEYAGQYKANAVLQERASSLDAINRMQQAYFGVIEDKMKEVNAIQHDLRHHFTMIDGFIKNGQYDELQTYIAECKTATLEGEPENYCPNNVINVLANHYDCIAEQNNIHFEMRCNMDGEIHMSDADLCGLFSNLLENAVEACLRLEHGRRFIRVALVRHGSSMIFRIWNSTDGNVRQTGGGFASSKGEDRAGYGLYSIRTIAEKYGGDVVQNWDRAERVFDSMVTVRA